MSAAIVEKLLGKIFPDGADLEGSIEGVGGYFTKS